jgi:hypothetical protein
MLACILVWCRGVDKINKIHFVTSQSSAGEALTNLVTVRNADEEVMQQSSRPQREGEPS